MIIAHASANNPNESNIVAPGQCMILNKAPIIVIAIPDNKNTSGIIYCFFIGNYFLFPFKILFNRLDHFASDIFLCSSFNSFKSWRRIHF